MQTVYFDYNATTPLDPQIREAMLPFLDQIWGNPSSIHRLGRQARASLDDAHERAARVLSCKPSEVVFTSGGTESSNLAVFGTARRLRRKGNHLVVSAIEHAAVLQACDYLVRHEGFEVSYLPVDREGLVSPALLEGTLRPGTILVSIMAANNEIGSIQPVAELGALCQERGICFHTDAVQWFGKAPFRSVDQFNADLVSVCSHKIYGPKGAGALFVKSPLMLDSLLVGGSHENERRAGTENMAAIIGFVEALERFVHQPVFNPATLQPLCERLLSSIDQLEGIAFVGSREHRLNNTISFVAPGAESIALLAALDLEGIYASGGSACSAGSLEPSHVVRALGGDERLARSLVRFSLGRDSTAAEVEYVLSVLPGVVRQVVSR
jgi:cysteine desulfurase